jgi:hypothetical protein
MLVIADTRPGQNARKIARSEDKPLGASAALLSITQRSLDYLNSANALEVRRLGTVER